MEYRWYVNIAMNHEGYTGIADILETLVLFQLSI